MAHRSKDPKAPSRTCDNWETILETLEEFPCPEVTSFEGDVTSTSWVFRGLADSRFELEPSIERHQRNATMPWPALEKLVTQEFKSHAGMHLDPASIPGPNDEFTWLAHMQHYSVPTRLLDFTYSPFVALYFAIRGQPVDEKRSHMRLWAINSDAVNEGFKKAFYIADIKARDRAGEKIDRRVSLNPDDFHTVGDSVSTEIQAIPMSVNEALLATGTRRGEMDRRGCVAVASPTGFNRRLASQQGVFLVNCAENLDLSDSLRKMTASYKVEWCKRLDIAADLSSEIERRLFQMNIHEQSLFPDIDGLAGLIRQKLRIHWK